MSWFRKALSICLPEPGSYYTVIDPVEFYEWRFTHQAPKGALFSLHLPPSDIFTRGKIIASASLSDQHLKQVEKGFRLQSDTLVEVILKVGAIPTPQELLDKYDTTLKTFSTGVERFKVDALTRLYLVSHSKTPHLFRIANYTTENVTMQNYGPVEELIKKIGEAKPLLQEKANKKQGRAFELEEWRRFQNAMDFVNNSHLHVDASKMERLLTSANIEPNSVKKISWQECYLEASENAQLLHEQIEKFSSNEWVKASRTRHGKRRNK